MSEFLWGLGVNWTWALGLTIGFPAALVVLNELIFALGRANHPLVRIVRILRTWVVPSLALVLFLRAVLGKPSTDLWVRLAETLVWVSAVISLLGFVNIMIPAAANRPIANKPCAIAYLSLAWLSVKRADSWA